MQSQKSLILGPSAIAHTCEACEMIRDARTSQPYTEGKSIIYPEDGTGHRSTRLRTLFCSSRTSSSHSFGRLRDSCGIVAT